MKEAHGNWAATNELPGTPKVAPRFSRAVKAERSRLEDKRAQLLHKREAAQAELGRIDRAVEATDGLIELLAPLLAADGGEPETAVRTAPRGPSRARPHRSLARRMRAIAVGAERPRCERDRSNKHNQRRSEKA